MKKPLIDFLYNADRAIASLFGAPPQETISSEIGRHAATNDVAEAAGDVLDDIQKDHCENAVLHADRLDAGRRRAGAISFLTALEPGTR